jgi:phospholipid transport system substrate-binding protein
MQLSYRFARCYDAQEYPIDVCDTLIVKQWRQLMQRRHFVSLAAAALAVAIMPAGLVRPALAQNAQPEAARFISNLAERAISGLTDARLSDAERSQRFAALLRENFDVPVIGRFVLGRYWNTATEQQRAEYLRLLEGYLTQIYADRFKEYSGERLRLDQTRPGPDNEAVVMTTISRAQGAPVKVNWRVSQAGGSFRILDVWIEGVSMAVTQRDEFGAIIQRGGGRVEALLASLRQHDRGVAQRR